MSEETPRPQINASKLLVGGGIAGLAFTIGSMLIFLLGVPILRYLFPPAILLGMGVAVLLRFKRHQTPGTPWLMSATEKTTEAASEPEPKTPTAARSRPRSRFPPLHVTEARHPLAHGIPHVVRHEKPASITFERLHDH